jgi:hypothetical protein
MKWLDARGVRESNLNRNLEYHQEFIIDNMERAIQVFLIH